MEKRDKAELKSVNQQLQALTNQLASYATFDHYVVDCLALSLGLTYQGAQVLDYGSVLK